MKNLRQIGEQIDLAVGLLFPKAAVARKRARSALYAAATTPRTSSSWTPISTNVNDLIRASAPTVKARVRQLVRDMPYFARAVDAAVDYTVGAGILFQSRAANNAGHLKSGWVAKIEDAFNAWADQADAAGKLHFYEIMQLAKRQEVENGEFLLVKKYSSDRSRFLPFTLQLYEVDWLTSIRDTGLTPSTSVYGASDTAIHQGVEYDLGTGRIVAYHFFDPVGWGDIQRIPAEHVIHGFRTLRPGQLRGISDFVSAVLTAHDLGDLMDAELDAAKMGSKWLAFVKTADAFGRQAGVVTTDSDTGKKIETLENATIEYLGAGEEIEFKEAVRPGANFGPYVRLILTMIATSTGIPYEILTGDYKDLNYSTGKMVRNDFAQRLRPIASRHIRQFCMPCLRGFMDSAVLSGKLPLPGYWSNPTPWLACEWTPPGMESVDPQRETKSMIQQVERGLRSPQEIVKARGRDLEDVCKEIKAANDLYAKYGIELNPVSLALANNPSALDAQDAESPVDATNVANNKNMPGALQ